MAAPRTIKRLIGATSGNGTHMNSALHEANGQPTGALPGDESADARHHHDGKNGQSKGSDDAVRGVDPDAPGAALVDPTLEQMEPNEPG